MLRPAFCARLGLAPPYVVLVDDCTWQWRQPSRSACHARPPLPSRELSVSGTAERFELLED